MGAAGYVNPFDEIKQNIANLKSNVDPVGFVKGIFELLWQNRLSILLYMVILFGCLAIGELYREINRNKRMYGLATTKAQDKNFVAAYLSDLKEVIRQALKDKGVEKRADLVYGGVIGLALITMLIMLVTGAAVVAPLAPIGIVMCAKSVFSSMRVTAVTKMELQLPSVIDTMIKIFAQSSDLKNMVHMASLYIDDPMKSQFEELTRQMMVDDVSDVLKQYAKQSDNIWIYAMTFILTSYKTGTRKEDVIRSLRDLGATIAKENKQQGDSIADKKYGVFVNYLISALAAAGGVAVILILPQGKEFFFTTVNGMLCFLGGYASIVATVLLNISMSKRK